MFSNLFKKSDKPSAAVFVDYEHWYYGYNNIFSMKPNVQEWYDELTEEYNVKKLMFFGDFNGSAIEKELPKLEKITKNVFSCRIDVFVSRTFCGCIGQQVYSAAWVNARHRPGTFAVMARLRGRIRNPPLRCGGRCLSSQTNH